MANSFTVTVATMPTAIHESRERKNLIVTAFIHSIFLAELISNKALHEHYNNYYKI